MERALVLLTLKLLIIDLKIAIVIRVFPFVFWVRHGEKPWLLGLRLQIFIVNIILSYMMRFTRRANLLSHRRLLKIINDFFILKILESFKGLEQSH